MSAGSIYFTEEQWHAIEELRLQFIKSNKRSKHSPVRPEVYDSWERCRQKGVDPERRCLRIKIQDEAFLRAYQAYEHMIELTLPMIAMADSIGVGGEYSIEMIDFSGVSLFQVGNTKLHEHVAEKSIFNESTMGTNAHSLCMRYRKPFQIIGPEHYCLALHNLVAAAVPLIDEDNGLVASLLFTRPLDSKLWSSENHRLLQHSMGLLISIAQAVESELRYRKCYSQMLELEDRIKEANIPEDSSDRGESKQKREARTGNDVAQDSPRVNTLKLQEYKGSGSTEKPIRKVDEPRIPVGEAATITLSDILGQSNAIHHAKDMAERFARTGENILLIGESGTGKEYFAQAIHNCSSTSGSFMPINCAAIPSHLIESELFGYENGAFTGAQRGGKVGKIELAHGGTLFLDEIGDMPLELQATLLRVLESKRVMRLGGKAYKDIDFRVIAATNQDLSKMVDDMKFREDLYYRLSTLCVELPPLRNRLADLSFFIQHYLDEFRNRTGIRREFDVETSRILRAYTWPGNIRQLKNAVFSSCYTAQNELIVADDLPHYLLSEGSMHVDEDPSLRQQDFSLRHQEETAVKTALARTDYNVTRAAELLNISRATLYRKLKEYNLDGTFGSLSDCANN